MLVETQLSDRASKLSLVIRFLQRGANHHKSRLWHLITNQRGSLNENVDAFDIANVRHRGDQGRICSPAQRNTQVGWHSAIDLLKIDAVIDGDHFFRSNVIVRDTEVAYCVGHSLDLVKEVIGEGIRQSMLLAAQNAHVTAA